MALVKRFTPGGNFYPDGTSTFAVLRDIFQEQAANRDTVDQGLVTKANTYTDEAVAPAVDTALAAAPLTVAQELSSGDSAEWYDQDGAFLFAIDGLGTSTPTLRGATGDGGAAPPATAPAGYVIQPSGDTTGATDTATVNSALQSYRLVVLAPGQWYQDAAYTIPSDTHMHCEGPFESFLVAGSNSNNVTNDISETTTTRIALTGRGHVRFDGNAANQVRQDTAPNYAGWKNIGIHFVNVDGLHVRGITWANTAMFGALCTGVRNAWWVDNRVEQDFTQPNQDGLDIGPACSFIHIDGLTGNTEDDVHSIFAKYSTSQKTVHPLYLPADAMYAGQPAGALYSAAGNNTHDIYVTRSHVNSGKNFFRLQAAEGSKLYNIFGTDIRHTGTIACRCLVIFGEMADAYIKAPPATDGSDLHTIEFRGFSGNVESLVYLDSHIKWVTVDGAELGVWTRIVSERSTTDTPPTVSRLHLNNIHCPRVNSDGQGNVIHLTGATVTDLSMTGLDLGGAARLLYGDATITNLRMDGYVGRLTRTVFEQTGGSTTGWINVRAGATPTTLGTVPTTPAGSTTITN